MHTRPSRPMATVVALVVEMVAVVATAHPVAATASSQLQARKSAPA